MRPRGKFVKTIFQDVGKSEKITKHENKEYHKDALKKAKDFLESYEDPNKSVTHDKNSDEKKYERNIHIIKIIIRTVLLCAEQGIEVIENKILQMTQEKSLILKEQYRKVTFLRIFITLDVVLMEHLEKGAKKARMVS